MYLIQCYMNVLIFQNSQKANLQKHYISKTCFLDFIQKYDKSANSLDLYYNYIANVIKTKFMRANDIESFYVRFFFQLICSPFIVPVIGVVGSGVHSPLYLTLQFIHAFVFICGQNQVLAKYVFLVTCMYFRFEFECLGFSGFFSLYYKFGIDINFY